MTPLFHVFHGLVPWSDPNRLPHAATAQLATCYQPDYGEEYGWDPNEGWVLFYDVSPTGVAVTSGCRDNGTPLTLVDFQREARHYPDWVMRMLEVCVEHFEMVLTHDPHLTDYQPHD